MLRLAASIFLEALRRFSGNDGWAMASHVAMSLMLSLFPFMLFTVSLASALTGDVGAEPLIELIFGVWPQEVADPIVSEIRAVIANSDGGLITLGAVLAVWFASNGAEAVRTALSRAYRDEDTRKIWHKRGLSLLFVLFGSVVVLGSAILGLALPAMLDLFGDRVPPVLHHVSDYGRLAPWITLCLVIGMIMACHVWMPGMRHSVRSLWPGVVFTVVVWGLSALGFSVYLSSFADYSATYAGLAGAMAALIFLYLLAVILIFGAELNGAIIRAGQASTY